MNKVQERKLAMLERIDVFLTSNPVTPANVRVTALTTELKAALVAMRTQGGDQQNGFGGFRLGARQRGDVARDVRGDLRDISDGATALPSDEFPGVADQFHLPKVRSYQRLMDTARAFLAAIVPVKAALIQRGFLADFDEQLQSKITEFEAATDLKHEGRQKQRANTAALVLSEEQIRSKVRELDSIVSKVLKMADPALRVAWKSAVRVYSAPRSTHNSAAKAPASPAPPSNPEPAPSPTAPSGTHS